MTDTFEALIKQVDKLADAYRYDSTGKKHTVYGYAYCDPYGARNGRGVVIDLTKSALARIKRSINRLRKAGYEVYEIGG